MSDYSRQNDFSAKDSLATGDSNKLIKGSEVDAEFDALVTAVATKYDSADLASQATAEAGTDNATLMTPLRVEQAVDQRLTEALTYTGTTFTLSSTLPTLRLDEDGASADEGHWGVRLDGGDLLVDMFNDSWVFQARPIRIYRTTGTADEIELNATTFDFNGTLDVDGGAHQISDGTSDLVFDGGGTVQISNATTVRVRDGATFRVQDSGDTDYVAFSHDGTDFNMAGTNTTAINVDTPVNAGPDARSITASTNTATTDYGLVIRMTSGSSQTFTLDGDPPTNAVVILDNASGNTWTIAASTSLIWALNAGTGNRTLADDGLAVAVHRGSGTWIISGGGLS